MDPHQVPSRPTPPPATLLLATEVRSRPSQLGSHPDTLPRTHQATHTTAHPTHPRIRHVTAPVQAIPQLQATLQVQATPQPPLEEHQHSTLPPMHPPTRPPSLQNTEVSGNTTPHPGVSPHEARERPRYSWAGGSGGNTPKGDTPQGGNTPKEGGDTPGYTPTYTPRGGDTPSNTPTYTPSNTPRGEGFTPQRCGDTPTGTPPGGNSTPGYTPTYTPGGADTPSYTPAYTPEGGDTPGYTPTYTPRSGETPSNTPSYGPDEGDTPSLTPTYTPEGGGQTPSDTPVHAPSEGSSFAPKQQDEAILSGEIGLPCSGQIPLECSTSPVIENHEAADDFQQSSEVIPDASSRTPEDVDRSKGSP